ncbi:hypothetical protein [Tellurirhabdus rosea]|uniref:hypothetical protein n=1 Tax=Tellurirhabdus rosea TaxID=2674997 RepID=UPI0022545087|nr:hypothetical protein [Tellurirhabdus rosea]
MKKVRLLLVIDTLLSTNELVTIGSKLCLSPSLEVGVLLLVDPGDISPTSAYYDDVMDQLQRQGYRYLNRAAQLMQTPANAAFLRISRHADRMVAAVARTFEAHYILLNATPGWPRDLISPDEFTSQVRLLTNIPILLLDEFQPVDMQYQCSPN